MAELRELSGQRVLYCDANGPPLDGDRALVDLIGDALSNHASLIAVPVDRLGAGFFHLHTGLAGAITQKAVTYRLRLAIVGDITEQLAESGALRAWVRECNRGGEIWFVPSLDALEARLSAADPPSTPADGG